MDCLLPMTMMDLAKNAVPDHMTDDQLLMEMAFALGIDAGPCQTLGDIWGMFSATDLQLVVAGFTAADVARVRLLQTVCRRVKVRELVGKPVLSTWQKLLDYVALAYAGQTVESFRVLFLDRKNRLMLDKEVQRGTVDHTPCYPRELARLSLLVECAAVILVHNHPSGSPDPSRADIEMTRSVDVALKALGIVLHDHLIVGAGGAYTSFKSSGLL